MPVVSIRKIIATAAVIATGSASATPLNDYNIILSGDFNVSGGSGHVEGKSFIGGNLVHGSVFAQHVPNNTTEDTVKVVGNVTGNNAMHIEAGYIAYGGTTNVTNSNAWNGICHGQGINQKNDCFKQVTDGSLEEEKLNILEQLEAESAYYASLMASDGTSITGDSNNKTFKYTGAATDLAVFNISVWDLANINWNVNFGSAVNILINVTGGSFNAGNAHINGFQNKANNVLWNFSDATALQFGDSWYGSVLALDAIIYTNSNLNGAIAAKSYQGNGEIHNYYWSYNPPLPPKVDVSEPNHLLLSLLGLGMLALGRMRRK
jgi:choice-of-anchor A domain-containing protein